jgi:hypothetical protein
VKPRPRSASGPGAAALLVLATAAQAAQSVPAIRLKPGPDNDPVRSTFEVTGLAATALDSLAADQTRTEAAWASVFSVFVDRDGGADRKPRRPIVGRHEIIGGALRFTPRFPLVLGLKYRAEFDAAALGGAPRAGPPLVAHFALPAKPRGAPTRLLRIDPIVDMLPENQLKFYLHFSAPMSRGEAYSRIHLEDLEGRPVDAPFLELGEELWDSSSRRLTLLLDPGRIKRGLKPREELGPVLVEGRRYRLTIDGDWKDAEGNPLGDSFRKEFAVGPPDDHPPDPTTWKLIAPAAASRKPLVIRFLETLDRAMLDRALGIGGPDGRPVPGTHEVSDDAASWRFTPEARWIEGVYTIDVDTTLEDLAGNNIAGPFEVDVERPVETRVARATHHLQFKVAPRAAPSDETVQPAPSLR